MKLQKQYRHVFPGKSYAKCYGEASPRLFYKKVKMKHIPGSEML